MRANEFITEATNLAYGEITKDGSKYLIAIIKRILAHQDLTQIIRFPTKDNKKDEHIPVVFKPSVGNQLSAAAYGMQEPPDINEVNVDDANKLVPHDKELLVSLLSKLETVGGDHISSGKLFKDRKVKVGKSFNIGNMAEGVLGGAVAAVMQKEEQTITVDDTFDMVNALGEPQILKKNAVLGMFSTTDETASVTFKLGLGRNDYNILIEAAKTKRMDNKLLGVFRSATNLVNESRIFTEALTIMKENEINDVKNTVIVDSDGVSDNTGSKADLKLHLNQDTINLLSLKVGDVKQFGQRSGMTADILKNFFSETLNIVLPSEVWNVFTGHTTAKDVAENVIPTIYKSMKEQIESQLSTAEGEAVFIDNLYKGIRQHATNDDDNVIMVILNNTPTKPGFKQLSFGPTLVEAMKQYKFIVEQPKPNYLTIHGVPIGTEARGNTNGKTLLLQLRSYRQKTIYIRNVIEMGSLLKEIAETNKDIASD